MSEQSSLNIDEEAIKRLMKEYQMYQPVSFERFDKIFKMEELDSNFLEEFKREADSLYKQDNYRFKRPAQYGKLERDENIFLLYE